MSEVTRILSVIEEGDPSAAEPLLPLVYDELRRLAAEKMAQEKPGGGWQEMLTCRVNGAVSSVAFSDDDQRIVAASLDDTVRIWEAPLAKPAPGAAK